MHEKRVDYYSSVYGIEFEIIYLKIFALNLRVELVYLAKEHKNKHTNEEPDKECLDLFLIDQENVKFNIFLNIFNRKSCLNFEFR